MPNLYSPVDYAGPKYPWPFGSLPKGQAEILYADPSWQFKVRCRENGLMKSPDRHYITMTTPQMMLLPVSLLAAKRAYLVMWVYDPMYPDALRLAESWGFPTFITPLFKWNKIGKNGKRCFGTGYHTRSGGSEECWLFSRGPGRGFPVLRHDIRKDFDAPRREHSRKPDEVPGWIVDLYGDRPRYELFARTERPGWKSWGKESDRFSAPIENAFQLAA